MTHKSPYQTDLYRKDGLLQYSDSPHSPHTIIPSLIQTNSTVLDIGCNTGFLASVLLKKNCKTDGVDINEKALKKAKLFCNHVYKRDLSKGLLDLPISQYDYIVFADILEHLPRPDLLLKNSKKYLKKSGLIIASIPNIARIELRISHLFGHFRHAPGIMSPDHLRFFTRRTAIELFENTGFSVQIIIPTGLGHMLNILPTFTAFQFIFIAKKQ